MSRALLLAVAVGALLVLAPPAGAANDFDRVFSHYRSTGGINPCKFSNGQLRGARGQTPNDIEQYAPDFPVAVDEALQARARGQCGGSGGGGDGAGQPSPGGATPSPDSGTTGGAGGKSPAPGGSSPAGAQPGTPAPPPPPTAARRVTPLPTATADDDSVPAPFLVLGALLGALLLSALVVALLRWRGGDSHRAAGARHAFAEAGYRAGGVWEDFVDWVRLGR